MKNTKILFMTAKGIGDLTKDLGIINSLKEKYPTSNIDILVIDESINQLLKYNTNISGIIKINFKKFSIFGYSSYFLRYFLKDIRRLNKNNYDLVICPNSNYLRRIINFFIKAKKKILLKNEVHDVNLEYEILKQLDIQKISQKPFLKIPKFDSEVIKNNFDYEALIDKNKKTIIINMFCLDSPNSIRDFDKWGEIIENLNSKYNLILVGKVNFNYKKYYELDYLKTIDLINKTNMDELIFLIDKSDLVLTVDSFIFHLSYGLEKKVLGLFGPIDPKLRIPPTENKKYINTIYLKKKCSPCLIQKHKVKCQLYENPICMQEIQTKVIVSKINSIIKNGM